MLGHLPHVTNPGVFETLQNDDEDRDIDVLLTGFLNGQTYPGRTKWANILLSTPATKKRRVSSFQSHSLKSEKLKKQVFEVICLNFDQF